MKLTPRQNEIYLFLYEYITNNDISPTYNDIRYKFGFNSLNSVTKHIKQLVEKGVISVQPNKKRSISLIEHGTPSVSVKLLGVVAAGEPIEAVPENETISVPEEFIGGGENFCLKVKGESMIDDGILDGDVVIINKKEVANNNEMVVAMINNEVTLKRFFKRKNYIELRPSNTAMEPIIIKSGNFKILGVVKGLLRKY